MAEQGAGNQGKGMRGVAVLAGMVVLLSLLIWAGVHNARSRRLAAQASAEHQASQAMLMPAGGGESGQPALALQGKSAPGFSLVDLNGNKVTLAQFKGHPVLVNFWATWCGPCKLEMPWFEQFHQKYAGDGLIILGVAADEATKTVIGDTAKKLGVTYPVLLQDDQVADAYGGVDYLPESFYVDRTGKVMLETAGLSSDAGGKDEIEANIKKLIAGGQ